MTEIHVVRRANAHLYSAELDGYFRARHTVYVKERGWKDLDRPGGRDIDQFDTADAIHLLAIDQSRVVGGHRFNPTTGPTLLRQYWNKPQETAEAIQDGWVRTGDIYRRDKDGFYFFEGRVDDTFKSSGMWVSPSEIEEVLCSHAAVHESAVISEPGPGGDNIVVAFVALRTGHVPGDALCEDFLSCAAESPPRYKRPSTVRFASHLPRTPTGKVQRFKLKAMFKQPDESLPLAG
jgi:acyl-coenzyme A synthetase/AMP-(fatty) acid ligase